MRKLKVAQIGTAHTTHSIHIFQTLLNMTDVFEVVGVADIDEHPKSTPKIFLSVPQMTVEEILNYPDLDGVIIECAEENLTKYALMAAEKKLPIRHLLEKYTLNYNKNIYKSQSFCAEVAPVCLNIINLLKTRAKYLVIFSIMW